MEESMKKQLIRATATAVLATGLTAGFASFAAADINTTGNGSQNSEKTSANVSAHVVNSNNLGANNDNDQQSHTGSASANKNTTSGDVETGTAANANSNQVHATVDNSSTDGVMDTTPMPSDPASLGSVSDTGYDSENTISASQNTEVSVNNENNINVNNENSQYATSGNATSNENTTGGNVKTGDATNTTSNDVELNVTN
jgi:hypothetical protein